MNTHPAGAAPFVAPAAILPDDDDDDEDFLLNEEEDWEDKAALEKIQLSHAGWYISKLNRYTPALLAEIEEWCGSNCRGEWKKQGWASGCGYSVALCFREPRDAVYYRLRWSDAVA